MLRLSRYSGLVFILALFLSPAAIAQEKEGTLVIQADPSLDSLVNLHKKVNEENQKMPGYRVQLYFGADRKKATELRIQFIQKYPDIPAYLVYQQPNYKVRAGDFRTRLEAYKLYDSIHPEYPSAFIVKDEIALPPLE